MCCVRALIGFGLGFKGLGGAIGSRTFGTLVWGSPLDPKLNHKPVNPELGSGVLNAGSWTNQGDCAGGN